VHIPSTAVEEDNERKKAEEEGGAGGGGPTADSPVAVRGGGGEGERRDSPIEIPLVLFRVTGLILEWLNDGWITGDMFVSNM